jgi:hypothetical protein
LDALSGLLRNELEHRRARQARRALLVAEVLSATALGLELTRASDAAPAGVIFLVVTSLVFTAWLLERRAARRLRQALDHVDMAITVIVDL